MAAGDDAVTAAANESPESPKAPDELVAAARRLEDEADETRDETPQSRELRSRAAGLRVRALGVKPYPVVVCSSCFRVTGWTDGAGRCAPCLRRARLEAAYTDPRGGWVGVSDERPPVTPAPPPPLGARLKALVGRRGSLERAAVDAWDDYVDPGETGPAAPEPGFVLEIAKRFEGPAPDDSGLLVNFWTERHQFAGLAWHELRDTKIGHADLLVPAEFSAGVPIEQLAEAWGDYQAAVGAFNHAAWERESARRDTDAQAQADREDSLRQQLHVADLLDEGR